MKINIDYDKKSIDNAIKQIEEYQKRLQNIIPSFLRLCAQRVQEIAAERLSAIGIGTNIETEILLNWHIDDSDKNRVILENTSDKATYVEFGVGEIGAGSPHDLAEEQGYKYNIPSKYKWTNSKGQAHWYISFHSTADIDLPKQYYERLTTEEYANRSRIYIRTQGQPATMFLFNAMIDFIDKEEFVPIIGKLLKGLE